MRTHICHLVTSFDTGGLQNGIVNLLNHGSEGRFRHTVLSLQPRDSMKHRLHRGDVRTMDFSGGRSRLAYRAIGAELRSLAPDILHTRNWGTWPDGVLAAMSAGVSRRVHGYHGRDLSNVDGERWRRRMMGRFLSTRVNKVVCLTESMKREFCRDFGTSESKFCIIPNGVDFSRMDQGEASREFGEGFLVGSVGRLDAVKNFPLLIRAFAAMKNRRPEDRLVLVGDGPERESLSGLVSELGLEGEAHVLGERNDIASIMKALDVYVQPSFYEGMSNTIVEAMSIGVPVVATDVGGNADVTGREGAANLVPTDDHLAMTAALESLRADETARRELGAAGRTRVRNRFTIDKMVAGYEALYEELCRS